MQPSIHVPEPRIIAPPPGLTVPALDIVQCNSMAGAGSGSGFKQNKAAVANPVLDLPNLGGFWDAYNLVEGGTVLLVTEQKFGVDHLVQSVAGDRPTYDATGLNGKPCWYGDAISQHLYAHGMAAGVSGSDKPFSIYAVAEDRVNVNNDSMWGFGSTATTGHHYIRSVSVPSNVRSVRQDDTPTVVNTTTGTLNLEAGVAHIYWAEFTGTTYTQGRDGSVDVAADPCNVGITTLDLFAVGCRYVLGATGGFIDSKFSMIAFFFADMAASRSIILDYGKATWSTP
jgi:hypothetical protein